MQIAHDHTVDTMLEDSARTLKQAGVPSSRLDAELLLAHTLGLPRIWLHAHGDIILTDAQVVLFEQLVSQRAQRIPVAQLVGSKEFYGRLFSVTKDTLIPRPESEDIITLLKELATTTSQRLIDVGTGSGCLGITAKLELPAIDVILSDISQEALAVAQDNARRLGADVTLIQSDLLEKAEGKFDIIVANLPYVDRSWDTSPELGHEPDLALYASDEGLALIRKLLDDAQGYLATGGLLVLEADPCQHASIIHDALALGYKHHTTRHYIVVLTPQ